LVRPTPCAPPALYTLEHWHAFALVSTAALGHMKAHISEE
jgi:hypothetical protein